MTQHSIKFRYPIFLEGYSFLLFAKNIGKNISKHLSDKCSQNLLALAKQSSTDPLKTSSERVIQTKVGENGDFIWNNLDKNWTKLGLK